jgi:hypothetical protein
MGLIVIFWIHTVKLKGFSASTGNGPGGAGGLDAAASL